MMISPESFVEEFKDKPLMDCILARDELIEEIRKFEMNPKYCGETLPSPLTQYIVYVEYVKELFEIIVEKVKMSDPNYDED